MSARKITLDKSREKYGEHWSTVGYKNAILDIFKRVNEEKENLGQKYGDIIYVSEVAQLLIIEVPEAWRYCKELFFEEKLEINGGVLIDYVKRFRFPTEIQDLLAYMVEDSLGFHDGKGDIFVYQLEAAIHNNTRYKHGKDAFGKDGNYPNVRPFFLLIFGMQWIQNALERARNDEEEQLLLTSQHNLGELACFLEEKAKEIRELVEN